ncbi:phage holin family protein [Aerococcus kribbianus]|uniref:Phage holin family protein n=1 Tax=Aerococcus kribbianus TaxID=2999064 RepID=A0A9X3FPB2_9LACT|nr:MULTISPECIES: phage holin family protein [unclassified Aerococcus]MCZ0717488.1 phage holin family protein [Aerococcus sp. YH-aer221]MCZ0725776.1 phage holin family protein [Aerococcus sp. YH-aer222]
MFKRFFLGLFIDAFGLMAIAWILAPNVYVADFMSAMLVALLLSIVNSLIRPIVSLLALPLNILTFGLFRFIVNGLMFALVASLFDNSFVFTSFWYAILTAVLFAIYHWVFEKFIQKNN